ncbi:MAG: metallophosphoesterase [Bacillota bacterium]|nr:metallophosphoesterase [Bacillota bacterium]
MCLHVAVVADTHGKTNEIVQVLKQRIPDYLLFAGDHFSDGIKIANELGIAYNVVPGNCDYEPDQDQEAVVTLKGHRILLVHGHQYGVKHDLNRLFYRGREMGAEAVVFGHTHTPLIEKTDGLWLINPGSPSRARIPGQGTYAMIKVDEKELTVSLENL